MDPQIPVRLRLLGPTALFVHGQEQQLGGPRQRAVLALLAFNAGRTLTVDRLIDDLWDEHVVLRQPRNNIQVYVSNLRRLLRPIRDEMWIAGEGSGYQLAAAPDTIDVAVFRSLMAEGRAQLGRGEASTAAGTLGEALASWSGEFAQDLVEQFDVFATAGTQLDEERVQAIELRIAADIQLGRGATVISELQALAVRYPVRERLWSLLMTALYRAGRQADALRTFQTARRVLADEAGLDPGPELRALEAEILGGNLPIDEGGGGEHVVFVDELGAHRRVRLVAGGRAVIGRHDALEICIAWDGRASRRHAELSRDDAGWWLSDLGSTNGTVLNGRVVAPGERQRIWSGATFVVGATTFTLVGGRGDGGSTSPSALTEIAEPAEWTERT